jgi:hypothetical protein
MKMIFPMPAPCWATSQPFCAGWSEIADCCADFAQSGDASVGMPHSGERAPGIVAFASRYQIANYHDLMSIDDY